MEQWVKSSLVMPPSHFRVPVQVLATLLPTQLLATPWESAGVARSWDPAHTEVLAGVPASWLQP